jgi:hypothetical protein
MKSLRNVVRIVAVASFAMATAASAQPGGGDPRSIAGKMSRPPGAARDDARAAGANLVELVNIRLSQLEEDLNLTSAQLPLWNAYRDRVIRMLDDTRRGNRLMATETTAPKRLDGLNDVARNRLAAVEDIVDAGKALYATLTPEQQAIADRRLALPLETLTGNDSGSEVRAGYSGRPGAGAPPPAK